MGGRGKLARGITDDDGGGGAYACVRTRAHAWHRGGGVTGLRTHRAVFRHEGFTIGISRFKHTPTARRGATLFDMPIFVSAPATIHLGCRYVVVMRWFASCIRCVCVFRRMYSYAGKLSSSVESTRRGGAPTSGPVVLIMIIMLPM